MNQSAHALGALLLEAGRPGAGAALDRLAAALAVAAPGVAEGPALMPLAFRPRLLIRLDERSRGFALRNARRWEDGRWVSTLAADDPWQQVRAVVASFLHDPDSAGPIAVAFAAADPDGRIRERAVAVMAERGLPEHLPFLALRCDDWVGPVRARAADALGAVLRDRPEQTVRMALPMAAHLSGRRRGGAALRIVEALVEERFDDLAPVLLTGRDQRGRRLAYTVGDRLGRWAYPDLLRFAAREPDPMVRLRAAETACREAIRRRDAPALRGLAGSRYAAVRSLALVGLAGLGVRDELAAFLPDPAALIRAYARSHVSDPAGRYRAMVADALTPGAVAGLGETGGSQDARLLTPLLGHPEGRIREAAVRALAELDAVPVDDVRALLTDPVAGVVREASLALRPYRRLVPVSSLWQLFADPRPEVRLAGHRLLAARGPALRLAAALMLAADDDPLPARRGRAEVIRLLPTLADSPYTRMSGWPDLRLAPEDEPPAVLLPPAAPGAPATALERLAEQARHQLGHHYEALSAGLRRIRA